MSNYTCCDIGQDTPYCGHCGEKKEFVGFRIGYLLCNVSDWGEFCAETGLNPWCLNEDLADSDDTYAVEVGVLKKYGILPEGES